MLPSPSESSPPTARADPTFHAADVLSGLLQTQQYRVVASEFSPVANDQCCGQALPYRESPYSWQAFDNSESLGELRGRETILVEQGHRLRRGFGIAGGHVNLKRSIELPDDFLCQTQPDGIEFPTASEYSAPRSIQTQQALVQAAIVAGGGLKSGRERHRVALDRPALR